LCYQYYAYTGAKHSGEVSGAFEDYITVFMIAVSHVANYWLQSGNVYEKEKEKGTDSGLMYMKRKRTDIGLMDMK